MITEAMIMHAVSLMHGQSYTMRQTTGEGDSSGQPSTVEHSIPPNTLVQRLLARYSLQDAEAVVRWLEIGSYVGHTGYGMTNPRMLLFLTEIGVALARRGRLSDEERAFVYTEDPYSVFVARQFRDSDETLFMKLRDDVLTPLGLTALDGHVDGVEAFRGEILRKIGKARYFVCILTRKAALASGAYASSVWLYQELGAAVALGKKPLVLVEEGMDGHYAGELQKNYEYVPFNSNAPEDSFDEVGRRLAADLTANHIPLPRAAP